MLALTMLLFLSSGTLVDLGGNFQPTDAAKETILSQLNSQFLPLRCVRMHVRACVRGHSYLSVTCTTKEFFLPYKQVLSGVLLDPVLDDLVLLLLAPHDPIT